LKQYTIDVANYIRLNSHKLSQFRVSP